MVVWKVRDSAQSREGRKNSLESSGPSAVSGGVAKIVWKVRDPAQSGSVLAWGARGRKFESCRPDN